MPSVTTKGQVTIPITVREAMGVKPGDEITF
jgi:antitoxin PrlF